MVSEHPYHSVTDVYGEYQLTEVPAGKYRLEIWHPDFGAKLLSFGLVRDGEVLALDAEMKTQR